MKKKISTFIKKNRKRVVSYFATNKLFIVFVLFAMIETVIIRANTIKNVLDYKPFISDLALIIIIGSFGFLFKTNKRYKYYRNWLIIITIACQLHCGVWKAGSANQLVELIAEKSTIPRHRAST